MTRHSRSAAGAHTLDDFAAHTADWVHAAGLDYGGATVRQIPPNGQGIAALMALGILSNFDLARSRPTTAPEGSICEIEAMELAFADAYRYVSDARTWMSGGSLLDRAYLENLRGKSIPGVRSASARAPPRTAPCTCAGDQDGMMVSLHPVELHGLRLGCRRPGTGISLQNRGAGFSLASGHPNEVGAASDDTIRSFRLPDARRSRPASRHGRAHPAA